MKKYIDRHDAGKILAQHLQHYAHQKNAIVLALPRGGVPVAYEVAKAFSLPLDIFIVRKLGVPGHEELAMGAMASGGMIVFNENIVRELHISKQTIDHVIENEKNEIARREITYRGARPLPDLTQKTVILVDDGIATGATIRAAIQSLRAQLIERLVVAIPVASEDICRDLARLADEWICPMKPSFFSAVGEWYEDFTQTSDEEVSRLMHCYKTKNA